MRKVRYSVASSLDGFIAGPNGEADWITMDPAIDFKELFKSFDTMLLGRRTFETVQAMGGGASTPGMKVVICSRTLRAADHPKLSIRDDAVAAVKELKAQDGKDIWLFGGGGLFRSLLDAGLVDTIELGVMPVLLGSGVPLMLGNYAKHVLTLESSNVLASGILMLTYRPKKKASRGATPRAR